MILDIQTLFSDQQSLALAAGSYVSTNSVDLWGGAVTAPTGTQVGSVITTFNGATPINDLGRADVGVLVQVTQAFTGGTAVQAQLVTADDGALTSNVTVLQESAVIPDATLVAGYQFRVGSDLPAGLTQRYLGVRYVTTGTHGAGKVTAGLLFDRQTNPRV